MQDDPSLTAINAAINCDWEKAVQVNSLILKTDPYNIDCLNRLGKAHLELGQNKKATTFFRKALKIDKYNQIAQKNLLRATTHQPVKNASSAAKNNSAHTANFLEEPGKTKLVNLVNIAPASILLKQNYADALTLLCKRHTVVVEDDEGDYLGALPDDLGHRLSILIKGGNRYEAITKSVGRNCVTVLLRETVRSKKYRDTPSFLPGSSADYLSFLRDDGTGSDTPVVSDDPDETDDDADRPARHADEEPEAA